MDAVIESTTCAVEPEISDNYLDVGGWPKNTVSLTDLLVKIGPIQIMDFDFPFTSQEGRKRRFNISHYFRKLPNGEKYKREWLVYSKTKDAAFCFCCKLYSRKINEVSGEGVSKWKNLNNRLNAHETSLDHLNCYMTWHDLIKRFKGSSTVDAVQQRQMDETTKH